MIVPPGAGSPVAVPASRWLGWLRCHKVLTGLGLLLLALALDPRAVLLALVSLLVLGAVAAGAVLGFGVRLLRRPIVSLSVLDAFVLARGLRWWERRHGPR